MMKTIQSTANSSSAKFAFKTRFLPLVIGIALPAFALTAMPATSEAGHDNHSQCNAPQRRVIGQCGHCNTPVYSQYQVIGRDRCGAPRYGWVNQSHQCAHQSSYRGRGYSDNRHYSGYSNANNIFGFIRSFR